MITDMGRRRKNFEPLLGKMNTGSDSVVSFGGLEIVRDSYLLRLFLVC